MFSNKQIFDQSTIETDLFSYQQWNQFNPNDNTHPYTSFNGELFDQQIHASDRKNPKARASIIAKNQFNHSKFENYFRNQFVQNDEAMSYKKNKHKKIRKHNQKSSKRLENDNSGRFSETNYNFVEADQSCMDSDARSNFAEKCEDDGQFSLSEELEFSEES